MRILAISSQVAYGPVGNSAAVPALEAAGDEVIAVPTVILSNQPEHGSPAGLRMPAATLANILDRLDEMAVLDGCDAVFTGYFTSNDQIHCVVRTIRRMKAARPDLVVLVDPIIGDGSALYVPLPVAEAIRDDLLPLATIATPNAFELQWLSGTRVSNPAEAVAAARRLAVAELVATSVPAGAGHLATLAITKDEVFEEITPVVEDVPHGTGDFLAGMYLSNRFRHPPEVALARSMEMLTLAIARSAGSLVLDVAGALRAGYKSP